MAPGAEPATIRVEGAQRTDVDGYKPPPDPPITFGFCVPDHAVSLDWPGPTPEVVRFHLGAEPGEDWLQWGGRRSPRRPLSRKNH